MLKLNGVYLPSWVKVIKVDFSVLPPIKNNVLQVRGKKGIYHYGQDLDIRKIDVEIMILADDINGVMAKTTELAEWFYHENPVQLTITDEHTKYWMVLPDGDTNIEEVHKTGKGQLSFICTEPFAYGSEGTFTANPSDSDPFYLTVGGNATTHPQIELTMKQDVDAIHVISDDGHILIGEPSDIEKTPTNTNPTLLNDYLTTTTNWTQGINVDGQIYGSLVSNGVNLVQQGNDYGPGTGWKGGALTRSLSEQLQDFEVEMWINFKSTKKEEIGRLECYLFDENNVSFGKIALVDSDPSNKGPRFEARAGAIGNNTYFVNDKRTTGVWQNFYGKLILKRKGKLWTAYIGNYDTTKKVFNSQKTVEWTDKRNSFNNKLAKIQVHIGTHSQYPRYASLSISHITVRKPVVLSSTQTPIIAEKDDVLLIDCEKSIVYKNGKPFYEGINPVTKFFGLQKGLNGLAISPPVADVKVTYKERWM